MISFLAGVLLLLFIEDITCIVVDFRSNSGHAIEMKTLKMKYSISVCSWLIQPTIAYYIKAP